MAEEYVHGSGTDSNTTAKIIIGFIAVVIMVVVAFLVINAVGKIDLGKGKNITGENYSFEIQANVNGNKIYNLDYELYRWTELVQEGTLSSDYKIEYKGVLNNTNYTLKILTDNYYDTETICNIQNSACSVSMQVRAKPHLDYIMYGRTARIIVYNEVGKLKDVVFCIQDSSFRILRLSFPDKFFSFDDDRLSDKYDDCYYPINRAYLEERFLAKLKGEYEGIDRYNDEKKTKYKSWENIIISDQDILTLDSIDIEQGFFEFSIDFEIDNRFEYEDNDRLKLIFIDEFHNYQDTRSYPKMEILLKNENNN